MKYYAKVGSNEYEIDIDADNNVTIDGEPIEVDLQQSGAPEVYSVLYGGHSFDMLIEPHHFDYAITFQGEQFQVLVEDERTRKLNTGRKALASSHGGAGVTAPIPGLVVKVLVAEGDVVEDGQPLVILEAMKMENEIRSIRPGTVQEVKAVAGQRVEQNEILLLLE